MRKLIFLVLCVVCFLLAAYPFVIYPGILRLLPKSPPVTHFEGDEISFTLVFCAYNEEPALPEKIANLRSLKRRYPKLEILAYSDMSTDRTLEMLLEQSDILATIPATERLGKAWGMRQLVAKAIGDVIIFTDANVILDEDAIERLSCYFSDPSIGAVAGHLRYINPDDSETADIGHRYWSLEELIKTLESQSGSTMGADGAVFARRRANYPEVPPHLLDDLTASISPLFEGYRVVSAPDVVGYERLTTDSKDEYQRKRRISCRAFNTHRYLAPNLRKIGALNRFKFVSHKLIRWFSPFLLLLSLIFGVFWLLGWLGVVAGLALILAVSSFAWLSWRAGNPKARKTAEILIAFVATGHGVVEALCGKTYQTWTPAQSRNN